VYRGNSEDFLNGTFSPARLPHVLSLFCLGSGIGRCTSTTSTWGAASPFTPTPNRAATEPAPAVEAPGVAMNRLIAIAQVPRQSPEEKFICASASLQNPPCTLRPS